MPEENPPKTENFDAATKLMVGALDRASVELDRSLKECIDQLTTFSSNVERTLTSQLKRVIEQANSTIDANLDNMLVHKDELADQLVDFEETEASMLVATGRDIRLQLNQKALEASDYISKLVAEQILELRSLVDNPEHHLAELAEDSIDELKSFSETHRARLSEQEGNLEKELSNRAQELESTIQELVASAKEDNDKKLEHSTSGFEGKIDQMRNQLTEAVTNTTAQLDADVQNGSRTIQTANDAGKSKLRGHLYQWRKELEEMRKEFETNLAHNRQLSESGHTKMMERKAAEVKDEINQIAREANTKVSTSHKSFSNSLKRVEKKYQDKLERLLSRFESVLAQEAAITTGSATHPLQLSHEFRELLHARLKARGSEISKAFQRQAEQVESEFTRHSASSNEKIETIRLAAVESADKQLRTLRNELERTSRNFNNELGELNLQLMQIDEAGKAAALAVMAYRSAMLSFGTD
jgi:hypothetical protein